MPNIKALSCTMYLHSYGNVNVLSFSNLGQRQRSREKGRDLTQSYDKSPYTNRNVKRAK